MYDIKSFGCLVYISILDRNGTKFSNMSEKCIFLGYENGMKGYRVYGMESHKISITRNVKFY